MLHECPSPLRHDRVAGFCCGAIMSQSGVRTSGKAGWHLCEGHARGDSLTLAADFASGYDALHIPGSTTREGSRMKSHVLVWTIVAGLALAGVAAQSPLAQTQPSPVQPAPVKRTIIGKAEVP